jgi:succinyl-diaminopimelate desuccinylase
VVPPGEERLWRHDPFAAEIADGVLYGRGASDMKSSIAAFVAAVSRFGRPAKGSISLLITGDEEGLAINGTPKMLAWLNEHGETLDHCIVGEPTATTHAGDTLKIGRRGSLTGMLTVRGVQGHVGYPHKARNPIPVVARIVERLSSLVLDGGTEHFEASTLSFTTVDVGNPAANVIPAEARATFNIRFNDTHTRASLQDLLRREIAAVASDCSVSLDFPPGSQAFLTKPGAFTSLVSQAVEDVAGAAPDLSTTGGTSDARFIKDHCPVVELGLPGGTMHKADECAAVAEIERLAEIYLAILKRYFA